MARDVFISHASEDASVATEVCALLEARGVHCWIAPRDVAAGAVWDEAILDAIEQSRAFLLILSKSANDSHYVKNEVNRAFSERKPIVTFRLEDVVPGRSLQLYLARHHWTDAFPPPLGARVENLATSITTLLDGATPTSAATAPQTAEKTHASLASRVFSPLLAAAKEVRGLGQKRQLFALSVLLAVAAIATFVTWYLKPTPASPARHVARFTVALQPNEVLAMANGGLAISPDGAYVAYTSTPSGGTRQLFLRPMDRSETVAIPGTDDATGPFFSPDGQWIAFTAGEKLKKIRVAGGTAIVLCDRSNQGTGSWGTDGTIIYPEFDQGRTTKLMRIPSAGGTPKVVATVDNKSGEEGTRWPEILPGGQAILYVIGGTLTAWSNDASIIAQSLKTGERKTLIQGGTAPHYVSTGHLVYAQGGRLLAVPFDPQGLEITGTAVPVLEDVWQGTGGYSAYSLSRDGSLAYVNGVGLGGGGRVTLTLVDRTGLPRQLGETPHGFQRPSLASDGQRLAIEIFESGQDDIWISDLSRGTLTRLSFAKAGEMANYPVWTPDGKRVIYSLQIGGVYKLMWRPADGTGAEEELFSGKDVLFPESFSPDGQLLIFNRFLGNRNLWVLPLNSGQDHMARPLIESPFDKAGAQISPDGRWLAYASNESGRQEIFVQPFPGLNGKWQISTSGGAGPRWSRDGRQLFFSSGNKMMVAGIETKTGFSADSPRVLFDQQFVYGTTTANYDVAPDGQHFLMLKPDATKISQLELRVVLNWSEELKQKSPTGKN